MKSRKNVFALEGGVGSGKTTVAEMLSVKYGYLFVIEYMAMLDHLKTFFEQTSEKRLSILVDLENKRRELIINTAESQIILMDRSILSLFAHEYAISHLEANYKNEKISLLINKIDLLIPNAIFFLTTNENVRRERCASRKSKMKDIFFNENYNKLLLEFYLQLEQQILIYFIDTTNLTILETADKVHSLMFEQKFADIKTLKETLLILLKQ